MRSLEIYKPDNSASIRLSRVFSKILPKQKNSLNSILISIRRNDAIKKYITFLKNGNQKTRNKFNNSYDLYIETINEYIMNKVYKKVKYGIADDYEKTILSKYYYILKLKDDKFEEYTYRKQKYLLRLDYYNIKEDKVFIDFKRMYEDKVVEIYNNLLKICEKNCEEKSYVKEVLAIINAYCKDTTIREVSMANEVVAKYIKLNTENKKQNIMNVILKNEMLLAITRTSFSEIVSKKTINDIYMDLIRNVNIWLNANINKKHFNEVYNLLLKIIKKYNPRTTNPIELEKEYIAKDKEHYKELEKYIEKRTKRKSMSKRSQKNE